MEFIRKSLWTLFALLALGCQQTQAMEKEESENILQIPVEMQSRTINAMFFMEKTDKTNFRDIGINLSLVCKNWREIIGKNAKNWLCQYFNIDEKDKDIFWHLFKGKIIYKPDPNSDNGRVDVFISALPNPLEGTFDLSQCGETGKHLSISTGYRKVTKLENANKVEIWFTPRFLVKKEINTTAGHLKAIFPSKWSESAQVGMLVTWGGSNEMERYDYLTTENVNNLSNIKLHENWKKTSGENPVVCFPALVEAAAFQVSLVN